MGGEDTTYHRLGTDFQPVGYEFVPSLSRNPPPKDMRVVEVFQPTQDFTAPADPEANCVFCEPRELFVFDIGQPLGKGTVILKAARGMLLPGYLLTVTREHITSFAELPSSELAEIDSLFTHVETELGEKFGTYFRFEHGSDNVQQCRAGAGACIEHAHQHHIPAPDAAEYILSQGHPDKHKLDWQKLSSFEDIAAFRGAPYMYLGYAGVHYAVADPGVPSQWVRRQVAKVRQLPEWDWYIYNGGRELAETFFALGRYPCGRFIQDGDQIFFEPKHGLPRTS
jgi:diadenosine tetraphosphate (Ap4A) HIT family hydrolase